MSTDRRRAIEWVAVGRVGRPHGVDGAFIVEQASEDPRRFAVGATLVVDGEPVEVVLSRRVGRGRRAIKLDRRDERGAELQVRRLDLPALSSGSYYVADLIGLQVTEEGRPDLGVVREVVSGPANDNLELESGALVPLIEDAVLRIDLERGEVVLNPRFMA